MQQLKNLNNYGLLVDLDGTIIQNNEFISLRVKKSIKKLSTHIPVSIVTGRGPQDVLKFSKQLDLFGPQYCENGTSVVDAISKKILDVSLISDEISSEIIKGFMNSNMEYLVVSNGKTYINPNNILKNVSSLVLSSKKQVELNKFVKKFSNFISEYHLEFSTDENGNKFINIHNNSLGKAKAYNHFKKFYKLSSDNIFFIGDGLNDLSIILKCKNSISMGNAEEEIKSKSKFITDSVYEDGVSTAIENIILPLIKA
tara:strand:- start:128 stop:895 length:768 start_codon:yes stop_codon:yes gene_type:complete